jgi:non-heme chloroperoxidase
MLVGHSAGGGEVARYIGRHGTKRVAKAVLVGAVTPLMLKTAANPGGLAIEAFDKIRAGVAADRSQFFKDLTTPFFGANRPGAKASQGVRNLHRGPREVRRPDPHHPRRGRPDRADRPLGSRFV